MIEKLYFNTVTKKYNNFYCEYSPPNYKGLFATLRITFITNYSIDEIIKIMEKEAEYWFERYPLPLMVSSFDKTGNYINLTDIKKESSFTLLIKNNNQVKYWDLLKNEDFPDGYISNDRLLEIYKDINYRTQAQVNEDAKKSLKPIIIWKRMYIIWILYVPIGIAVIEFYSPTWLAFIAMFYSIYKAIVAYRKYTGKIKPTEKEKNKEEKSRKMEHYYYHCELNPKKFEELKYENLKKEIEMDIKNKFNSLK